MNTSIVSIVLLVIAVSISTVPLLKEECGQGYYEFRKEDLSLADGKKWFGFVEDNICG